MTTRQTALITGASSGIGYELAKLFSRGGYDLVLIARSAATLEELARTLRSAHGVTITVLPKDLAQPEAANEIVAALTRAGITVDVLVNNAGFGTYGSFVRSDLGELWQLLQVNIIALTQLTHLLLLGMVERQRGKILNVASTAAF